MSRSANPYDNATCESLLKTLKREDVYGSTYRDFEDLRERVEEFIERYYNQCRLHSALGYCSPASFGDGADSRRGRAYPATAMTFIEFNPENVSKRGSGHRRIV